MTSEIPENPFRERRSAHIEAPVSGESFAPEDDAGVPAESAPPRAEPEPAVPPGRVEEDPDLPLDDMAQMELPDPSFHEIVYEYAIRAQQFLGDAPITRDGERRVLPNYAKHMIDLLGILEERTRGNLTPEESQLLSQVLDDLRLRYVSVTT